MINSQQAEYLVLILYTIALSDNEFHGKEIEYIKNLGLSYGISEERIEFIISNPHKILQVDPDTSYEKMLFAYSMCELLYADKKVDPREVNVLRRFLDVLGMKKVDELSAIMIDSVIDGLSFQDFYSQA